MTRVVTLLCLAGGAGAFVAPHARVSGRAAAVATSTVSPEAPVLSELVGELKPSATIAVHALTMELRAAGEEVVSLCVGEPDFPPPRAILDAVGAAAAAGDTRCGAASLGGPRARPGPRRP